ncbi:MAG: NADH:ubiquinone oxidoreductase subunit J [Alphaproteobacteria bacterium RIFCSPHIGHO2_12_FULL_63_12]|nr:MAG: NADH:ubiquinone oxidoreductase subunit J [Alphaproteobacteria bacterium RIFCSPHIGHO2_12_FULL_63_12]
MTLAAFAFWVFAVSAVASGLMVISSRNPVHSVLFLILTFISAAGLFVLMGAEYLAMLLVVVYVGAVAVLFLFVVMMLDVDFVEMKQGFLQYLPIGVAIAGLVVVELILAFAAWQMPSDSEFAAASKIATRGSPLAGPDAPNNIEGLGLILFTDYVHYFQIAGMVLLIAMIGAIVLTFRTREGVKKQDPAAQVARRRDASVELKKVKSGQGI